MKTIKYRNEEKEQSGRWHSTNHSTNIKNLIMIELLEYQKLNKKPPQHVELHVGIAIYEHLKNLLDYKNDSLEMFKISIPIVTDWSIDPLEFSIDIKNQ